MNTSDASLPPDNNISDLHGDLLDICRRLKLSVQVVQGDTPSSPNLLGSWWTPAARLWSRLDTRALRDSVADVARSREPHVVHLDDVSVAVAPIPGSTADVVLLARHDREQFPELDTIAPWIASAVSDRASAASTVVEIQRLASLLQILDKAAASESEHEVVRAFVEALSVWTDTECWGYLGDRTGTFHLHVTLPGSVVTDAPLVLDEAACIEDGADRDIALVRIQPQGGSDWLIALPGAAARRREQRAFLLYCRILGLALTSFTSVSLSRLTWALFDCLGSPLDHRTMSTAATDAAAAVGEALGAPVFLDVRNENERLLSAGVAPPRAGAHALVVSLQLRAPLTGTLSIGKPVDRPLTRRDETVAQHAAHAIGVWLNAAVSQPWFDDDERSTPARDAEREPPSHVRSFDREMIIVSYESARAGMGEAAICLSDIQRHLRPSDTVASMPSGSFGIMLRDADRVGAEAIATRLRKAMSSWGQAVSIVLPSPHSTAQDDEEEFAKMDVGDRAAVPDPSSSQEWSGPA